MQTVTQYPRRNHKEPNMPLRPLILAIALAFVLK